MLELCPACGIGLLTLANMRGSVLAHDRRALFMYDDLYLHRCNTCGKVFYDTQTTKILDESKL